MIELKKTNVIHVTYRGYRDIIIPHLILTIAETNGIKVPLKWKGFKL